jgi:hypothetical protein
MLKLAVIKLGARISYGSNDTSGGNGEARSLIEMLHQGGAEVHPFTKILKKDTFPDYLHFHNIEDEYNNTSDYDALIVINGSVNFFGGAEDPSQILNYHIINHFDGPIIYIYCDPNLPLKQIWPSISKKEWAGNWNKEDIEITRPINVICQVYNTELAKAQFKDTTVSSIQSYEFHKFPMMFPERKSILGKQVVLSYGGTFRSGRREKKLIDFYFGYPDDISVEIFGNIKLKDFNEKKISDLRSPDFTGAVAYEKMIEKMSEAMYHVVIGDTKYPEFEMINQRTYESIMAGCITFVDADFDRKKRIFGSDPALSKLLYVINRQDVFDTIEQIEKDGTYDEIIAAQKAAVGFNQKSYTSNFVQMVQEIIE